jgi:hypothetical protein
MCQKLLRDWLPSLGVQRAPERLLVTKSLRSSGHELMRALLQCFERSQPMLIDLLDGFGSTFVGSPSSTGFRAPDSDFFKFDPL